MAWATVSGVPTSALELPAPPVTAAVRVHSARSNRSPSSAIAMSRCEPVFSGFLTGRRRDSCPPDAATRASIRATMPCAFSQACSSVGAIIGRKATWILGTSARPAARAVEGGSAPAGAVRRGRGPAERDLRARLLDREHVADEVGELVVLPVVVERLAGGP